MSSRTEMLAAGLVSGLYDVTVDGVLDTVKNPFGDRLVNGEIFRWASFYDALSVEQRGLLREVIEYTAQLAVLRLCSILEGSGSVSAWRGLIAIQLKDLQTGEVLSPPTSFVELASECARAIRDKQLKSTEEVPSA